MVPRVCHKCGKGKGTMAYAFVERGVRLREYFHPACFRAFLNTIKENKDV